MRSLLCLLGLGGGGGGGGGCGIGPILSFVIPRITPTREAR